MSYVSASPVIFPFSRYIVFNALIDLAMYPAWNSGMTTISQAGRMTQGLRFRTSTNLGAYVNNAHVTVERLVENEYIELVNNTGAIAFRILYNLVELSPYETELICTMRFEFRTFEMNATRPVIEAMTRARVRRDLMVLCEIIIRNECTIPATIASQNTQPLQP